MRFYFLSSAFVCLATLLHKVNSTLMMGIILRVEIDEFNYLDHYYDTCSPK